MRGLIHDATIVTTEGAAVQVRPHYSLLFGGGVVESLAPAGELGPGKAPAGTELIPGSGCILIPGLVNTHHHLFQSLTRCLPAAQDQRLFRWLLELYARWGRATWQAVRLAAQVSIAELLHCGCTTTSDHFYLFPPGSDVRIEAVLSAAEELGIRIHCCRGSMTLGQSGGGLPPDTLVERDADVLDDYARVLDRFHDPRPLSRQRIDLAPCSPFNVTRELLRDTRILARERGVRLHTHLAETLEEDTFCRQQWGCRPMQYLADLDWLGTDVYLAHCVWLNDAEVRLLARTGTGVALCPTSNLRLGSGIPRIGALRRAGVRLGLGVDGSSSNDGGNLLAEAKQALLLARVEDRLAGRDTGGPMGSTTAGAGPASAASASAASAGAASPEEDALWPVTEAYKLATIGGATCLGRPELGRLGPGLAADFALFRMDDLALAGASCHDPLAALVLCDRPRAERVFVGGEEVVRAGRLVAMDEDKLAAEFQEFVRRWIGGGSGSIAEGGAPPC